ncbi:jg7151 [Pararge aegeria aegeria]|uniref:Jg7151 protein n=1 Tax=Pararge aegeria aegeria TaxID=348720 RepID=A0A8S4RSG6_9NEOP|nr:jg7151 [Pararge aegeria aegeria]
MEADETPTHVMLECTGVTEQREIYLGSPATISEVLSNLGAKRFRAETAQREEEEVRKNIYNTALNDVVTADQDTVTTPTLPADVVRGD